MSIESKGSKRARATKVCDQMEELYGDAQSALDFSSPYTLLVAVMLSAQTTDRAVNKVSPELFRRWPGPAELAEADIIEVEKVIHSLGFYHSKAQHLVKMARMLIAENAGEVPDTMLELCRLPGVGRKTANIVLSRGFGHVEGIAVDTHVFRIATRLQLTHAKTPLIAERDLLEVIPKTYWAHVNETWIYFGREICCARAPHCELCPIADLCPSFGNPNRYRQK